jgi:hypothetical protein
MLLPMLKAKLTNATKFWPKNVNIRYHTAVIFTSNNLNLFHNIDYIIILLPFSAFQIGPLGEISCIKILYAQFVSQSSAILNSPQLKHRFHYGHWNRGWLAVA